jgi:glycosyltransferase involved in cell wall biosynthesis
VNPEANPENGGPKEPGEAHGRARERTPLESRTALPRAGSRRPRVLVLDEEIPIPANSGKRIRTLNLLTKLASDFEIDLLVHSNGADREGIATLERRGVRVHVAPSSIPQKRGLLFPFRLLANLASPLPYSVQSHLRPGYRAALARLLEELRPDLVHCEWTPYAAYLPEAFSIPTVIAAHNVEYRIWERLAETETSPWRRAFVRLQARRMRRFEARVFARFGRVTAVSEDDARTIRALGCPDVTVVPNGVDTDYFRPLPEEQVDPRSLVFTGSMDWFANQDAIRWFVDEVKPLDPDLRAATLHVVGRTPPEWLTALAASRSDLVVTGTVPDVRAWVAKAAAVVVPLRVGGGSRLKILEALAMQKAVISTRVGAEGLDVTEEENILLVDSARDFAAATLRILRTPADAARLGAAGRGLAEARYDWSRISRLQETTWNRAVKGGREAAATPMAPPRTGDPVEDLCRPS